MASYGWWVWLQAPTVETFLSAILSVDAMLVNSMYLRDAYDILGGADPGLLHTCASVACTLSTFLAIGASFHLQEVRQPGWSSMSTREVAIRFACFACAMPLAAITYAGVTMRVFAELAWVGPAAMAYVPAPKAFSPDASPKTPRAKKAE